MTVNFTPSLIFRPGHSNILDKSQKNKAFLTQIFEKNHPSGVSILNQLLKREDQLKPLVDTQKDKPALTEITHLNRKITNLTDAGCHTLVKNLANHPEIQHLDLSANFLQGQVINTLIPLFSSLPALRSLNLSNTFIESEGAQTLAASLHKFTSLTHLDLSRNEIGTDGIQSFLEPILRSNTLTQVNFEDNLNAAGIRVLPAIRAHLKHNQVNQRAKTITLELLCWEKITDAGLSTQILPQPMVQAISTKLTVFIHTHGKKTGSQF